MSEDDGRTALKSAVAALHATIDAWAAHLDEARRAVG